METLHVTYLLLTLSVEQGSRRAGEWGVGRGVRTLELEWRRCLGAAAEGR